MKVYGKTDDINMIYLVLTTSVDIFPFSGIQTYYHGLLDFIFLPLAIF